MVCTSFLLILLLFYYYPRTLVLFLLNNDDEELLFLFCFLGIISSGKRTLHCSVMSPVRERATAARKSVSLPEETSFRAARVQ